MRRIRLSGWLALAALVLTVGGPLSLSAQTASPQQSNDEKKTADVKNGEQTSSEDVVLVAVAEAPPAAAAKVPALPAPAPPPRPFSFRWTGLYFGVHIGHGSGNADTTITPLPTAAIFINLAPTTLQPDPGGVLGGGQVGFNWQRGKFVFGAEADLTGSGMDGTDDVSPIIQNNGTPFPGAGFLIAHQDTSWVGTLRPRLGVTLVPRLLVYGTAGLAYGHVAFSADSDFRPVGTEHYPAAFDKTKKGWTAGAGAEIAILKRWTVKGEYLYYDLGSETFTANPVPPLPPFQVRYNWETTAQTIKFGLNFKF